MVAASFDPGQVRAQQMDNLQILVPGGGGADLTTGAQTLKKGLEGSGLVGKVTISRLPAGAAAVTGSMSGVPSVIVAGPDQATAPLKETKSGRQGPEPLALLSGEYYVLVISKASEFRSLAHLVEMMVQDPKSVTWVLAEGSNAELAVLANIAQSLDVDPNELKTVTYTTATQRDALLGGSFAVAVGTQSEFIDQIERGDIKALGIAAPDRVASIDVPTLREQGVYVEGGSWTGIMMPPGSRPADREAVGSIIGKLSKSPIWRKLLAENGWRNLYRDEDQFSRFIGRETESTRVNLQESGLTPIK
ncbi:tripartite tricarboxylate transporter substrate-binding protein [Mesorhizobium dulcispinae]|uniref:tripartite tricarboxylate transporter substrate-binding protein n=1 Tax=Mesorhizobium dulcispinae TaxID=3072316 RepID=UPI002A239DF8|nr:tripartite tricarboxylate transporter substrate-binding protein [Mesorhizobium sp. VK23D]MDX8520967.1 tripartite tricarboxylate transporter substrate-binding protein [Mesorhizobium sp. VK23D]